mgnify:CR=1 FL=1
MIGASIEEGDKVIVDRALAPKHDDIVPLVRILGKLHFQGVINCVFSLPSPVFAGPLDAEKSALLDKPGGGSAAEWDRYAASKNRPFWTSELRFYGPLKVIQAQWEHVKEQLAAIDGVKLPGNASKRHSGNQDAGESQ